MRPIWHDIRLADIATLLNGLAGMASMWFTAQGDQVAGALLILIAILLDGVDGAVARLSGGGPLGKSIDNLCDGISFGAAPAFLVSLEVPTAWLVLPALYFVMAMLRLSRYAADTEADEAPFFYGLSSPGAALLVAGAVLVNPSLVAPALVLSIMMVSTLRYPKLRGWLGITAVILILATIVDHFQTVPYAGLAMLVFMAVYLLFGPLYVRTHGQA